MKVLMLVQADHGSTAFGAMYEEFSKYFDTFDIRWLSGEQQANLKSYFENSVNTHNYDRIVLFVRFKKATKQISFIRTIPNLAILEYDACQNYMADSKYQGVFSKYYHALPWVRIINTGHCVAQKLEKEGFDTAFMPKCFDDSSVYDLNTPRDIELGFIGNIKSKTYRQRREFLENMSSSHGLVIAKTNPGNEYNEMLNRIRFFISADMGIGEYMQKNFEAMAAGCASSSHGIKVEEENKALGLIDMENIVLYNSEKQLLDKLAVLKTDKELQSRIIESS